MDTITNKYKQDNELRTRKMEEFIIEQAKQAGVINIRLQKVQRNPNRWAKHLAPWFGDICRDAR